MTQREKDLFYEVLELLRKEVRTSSDFRNRDWKDACLLYTSPSPRDCS